MSRSRRGITGDPVAAIRFAPTAPTGESQKTMRKTRRTSRVGESVRDALVDVFRHEIKDIDLGLLSITGVEVSPDMHFARVFVSGLDEKQTKDTVRELQQRKGFIRSQLGKRVRLRSTPELDFKFDETAMRAGRIEDVLAEINKEPKSDDE
jgi:ribosome-binding factor A